MTYNWLNFEKEEKGYKPFTLTTQSIRENVGKKICYLRKRDIVSSRGICFTRFATLHSKKYSQIFINNGHDSIDIRDVVECGIEI